ncbi:MAG: hypothetical protein ABI239_13630 [Aquihabitans sp.]
MTAAWEGVIGQDAAVSLLQNAAGADAVHAWLFLGPRGSGKRAAARAFAGELLAGDLERADDQAGADRARDLARLDQHPDVITVERVGASISAEQADDIVKRASRTAVEGRRKVMILDEFHLMAPNVAPKLLKTIEEPPDGTFFLVLADELPKELVTIASRCIRVDFVPLTVAAIAAQLEAEGTDPAKAAEAASFAGGDLDRARLLTTDERLALRLAGWRDLPRRLNGSGSVAAAAVDDIRAAIDDAEAPLKARHVQEVAEVEERIERYGQRGSGSAELDKRHKRESRRFRVDELRLGLGALAAVYRDEMVVAADRTEALAGLDAVQEAAEGILYNPNEELLLLALASKLPSLV